jgi:hypothetical protein
MSRRTIILIGAGAAVLICCAALVVMRGGVDIDVDTDSKPRKTYKTTTPRKR